MQRGGKAASLNQLTNKLQKKKQKNKKNRRLSAILIK